MSLYIPPECAQFLNVCTTQHAHQEQAQAKAQGQVQVLPKVLDFHQVEQQEEGWGEMDARGWGAMNCTAELYCAGKCIDGSLEAYCGTPLWVLGLLAIAMVVLLWLAIDGSGAKDI
jgi:hypothetical protein